MWFPLLFSSGTELRRSAFTGCFNLIAWFGIALIWPAHVALHSPLGYLCACFALPPSSRWCSRLPSHRTCNSYEISRQIVMSFVLFRAGLAIFATSEEAVHALMCNHCFDSFSKICLTASKFHDVASERCTWTKDLWQRACSPWISHMNSTCFFALSHSRCSSAESFTPIQRRVPAACRAAMLPRVSAATIPRARLHSKGPSTSPCSAPRSFGIGKSPSCSTRDALPCFHVAAAACFGGEPRRRLAQSSFSRRL